MKPLLIEIPDAPGLEAMAAPLANEPGLVLFRSAMMDSAQARYSFLAARPFLTFRSFGSRIEIRGSSCSAGGGIWAPGPLCRYGNPWRVLEELMPRYEMIEQIDLPFPLGGCFGYWGYDLKNFIEPKLPRRAFNDLELPDCHLGFYDSLVAFDHCLGKAWIVSTGLGPDGSRTSVRARSQVQFWQQRLSQRVLQDCPQGKSPESQALWRSGSNRSLQRFQDASAVFSNLSQAEFMALVARAQTYIRAGDIYQVNLAQRLCVPWPGSGWDLFERLTAVSPAPFSAYLCCGDFSVASSSPELFLRASGSHVCTRPIKGTRPRSAEPARDAQLGYELQTSAKELAELVMITDLLRNDLGRVCEFGSIEVLELARLERYPQVQHLVSTIEGRLRSDLGHFGVLSACFPGGSITGAPKFRAMEIIDELEAVSRGPYTGALGYIGFNRESQLSIGIRTAICKPGVSYFHAGAGIVADSSPLAEYEETLAKARGFIEAVGAGHVGFRVSLIPGL